jgi:hypothetical protein
MKTIVTLISFCVLLPLVCANGGKVKTIDGKQMPKDSVAEFYLCQQEGKRFADSIMFVYAVKIDSVTVSELLHGVKDDYSWAAGPNTPRSNVDFDKADAEFGEAYQLRKVYLTPGKHVLILRCAGRFTRSGNDKVYITTPFQMVFDVSGAHTYRFVLGCKEPLWQVAIEDKIAKTTVVTATATVISK